MQKIFAQPVILIAPKNPYLALEFVRTVKTFQKTVKKIKTLTSLKKIIFCVYKTMSGC